MIKTPCMRMACRDISVDYKFSPVGCWKYLTKNASGANQLNTAAITAHSVTARGAAILIKHSKPNAALTPPSRRKNMQWLASLNVFGAANNKQQFVQRVFAVVVVEVAVAVFQGCGDFPNCGRIFWRGHVEASLICPPAS